MKQFDTVDMASGGLALVLEAGAHWTRFPTKSKEWIKRLKAEALSAPVITADERLVEIKISEGKFWITYDNFQSSIQLEPTEPRFNHIIRDLQKMLGSDS